MEFPRNRSELLFRGSARICLAHFKPVRIRAHLRREVLRETEKGRGQNPRPRRKYFSSSSPSPKFSATEFRW